MNGMEQAMQMGMWGGFDMATMAAMNNMAMMSGWNQRSRPVCYSRMGMNPAFQASVPLTRDTAPPQPQVKTQLNSVAVIMTITAENDKGYTVEKEEETINEHLDVDWTWFTQLVGTDPDAVVGRGSSRGVVMGVQDVAERINDVVALFVVPEVGESGEELAIQAAINGGRSYILSRIHELYQDVSRWRCAGILKSAKPLIPEPSRKRGREDGKPKVMAPSQARNDPRAKDLAQLPEAIKYLGSAEGLKDPQAIPEFTKRVGRFLITLGAEIVYKTLADAFRKLEGKVAFRKSLVYTAHELFTKRKREITLEDQKQCVEQFLLAIGPEIRAMKAKEREAYCELIAFWGKHQVVALNDLKRLKDAWDVDEEGDFDDL